MRLIALVIVFALSACGPTAGPMRNLAPDEFAGRLAGPPQACVSNLPTANLRVIDSATLAYDSGRTIYINRLRAPCPGLNPMSTLILDAHGPQYCRGDHFRAVETGQSVPGAVCAFGDWTPYRRP